MKSRYILNPEVAKNSKIYFECGCILEKGLLKPCKYHRRLILKPIHKILDELGQPMKIKFHY